MNQNNKENDNNTADWRDKYIIPNCKQIHPHPRQHNNKNTYNNNNNNIDSYKKIATFKIVFFTMKKNITM